MALYVPKDRKSLFRQFLAGMYDAVVITDPNGHVIEINPRAEEYFGYCQDEVLDRPISFFISGLAPEIVQRIRRGLAEDRHMMIDANGLMKGGGRFSCEVTVSMIDLTDPDDLVFTVRNTERRRAINNMYRAKSNAFGIAQCALFCCDVNGRFRDMNEQFLSMFGFESEDDARKHVFTDVFDEEPLPGNFRKGLAGERTETVIVAENDEGASEEIEIVLAPNPHGRKNHGVVGSVFKVR